MIGSIVGGVIGLGVGAYEAVSDQDEELGRCLRENGYQSYTGSPTCDAEYVCNRANYLLSESNRLCLTIHCLIVVAKTI